MANGSVVVHDMDSLEKFGIAVSTGYAVFSCLPGSTAMIPL